jgi:PAS domain-containing protein
MSNYSSATQVEFERHFASSAQILRSLANGGLVADGDGLVRQANSAAADLLGTSVDALLGMWPIPGGAACRCAR